MTRPLAALAAILSLGASALPAAASAEVRAAEAGGFQVAGQITVARPREAVWSVLLAPDGWWSPQHSWFEGSTLSLDPRPGGCWCEAGPGGAGAMHLIVGFIHPPETLQLLGGLGPLQGLGLDGVLTLTVKAVDGGSEVSWIYTVTGFQPGGVAGLAAPVDGVLAEQMGRLKAAAEA